MINSVAIGGFRQSIIVVDDKGSFVANLNTRDKKGSTVVEAFEKLFVRVPAPELLVIDRDSPFMSAQLSAFCVARRIQLYPMPTARNEFNGLAERTIGTLRNMVRSALIDSRLPTSFWGFALDHAVYVLNRSAHKKFNWSSPALQIGFTSSSLEFNRVFGCVVFFRVMQPLKLEPRARPGVFVGIDSQGTHATYKIYDFRNARWSHVLSATCISLRIRPWSKYVSERDGSYDLPEPVVAYFDPHKDHSHEQKVAHSLVPPDNILMASYLSDNDVKLLSEPELSRRPMNRKAVKKRVDKMRSDALKNDEPLDYRDIQGRYDSEAWFDACDLEDNSHLKRGTMELTHKSELPPGVNVAGYRRVFKRKRDSRRKCVMSFKDIRRRRACWMIFRRLPLA